MLEGVLAMIGILFGLFVLFVLVMWTAGKLGERYWG